MLRVAWQAVTETNCNYGRDITTVQSATIALHGEIVNQGARKSRDENPPDIRVGFWQNGFFADFCFWAAGFFSRILSPIFSPHFCGEKVPRKILQENPRQSPPNFIQQKSPTHFRRGAVPTDEIHSIFLNHLNKFLRTIAVGFLLTCVAWKKAKVRHREQLRPWIWVFFLP